MLQGVDLTDEELVDHISEMCVMSKSLAEYEGEPPAVAAAARLVARAVWCRAGDAAPFAAPLIEQSVRACSAGWLLGQSVACGAAGRHCH